MNKKAPKKQTTLDDLAIMVAHGFERIENRFTGVDEKFDQIDSRFDKLEKRLEDVEEITKATRRDVLNLGERFISRYEFDTLSIRVNKLESKTKNKTGK